MRLANGSRAACGLCLSFLRAVGRPMIWQVVESHAAVTSPYCQHRSSACLFFYAPLIHLYVLSAHEMLRAFLCKCLSMRLLAICVHMHNHLMLHLCEGWTDINDSQAEVVTNLETGIVEVFLSPLYSGFLSVMLHSLSTCAVVRQQVLGSGEGWFNGHRSSFVTK